MLQLLFLRLIYISRQKKFLPIPCVPAFREAFFFNPILLSGRFQSLYFPSFKMRALPTWVDKVHDKDRVEQW